jgi:hypothetical protein
MRNIKEIRKGLNSYLKEGYLFNSFQLVKRKTCCNKGLKQEEN